MEGQTAVISGASRGIGRAIALDLAERGVNIAFTYYANVDQAEKLAHQITRLGVKAIGAKVDCKNQQDVNAFVKKVKSQVENIDYLINNAGIIRDKSLMMMNQEDWTSVIETNLYGTFYLCQAVIMGFLKRKKGAIVNISSTAGLIGNIGQVNYSASKAGVIGFSKALAKEVAPYNVRVNVVAPGFIDTDILKTISDKKMKDAINTVPFKRIGSPQEVAKVVSFLLSEDSSYITGQVIPVDGGLAI